MSSEGLYLLQVEREIIYLAGAKVQYSTVEDEHRTAAVSTTLFTILVMYILHGGHMTVIPPLSAEYILHLH